jgi:type IV secretory pathway VirD2 relaxase
LERDGASREGARSPSYSTFSDEADGKQFLERSEGDRHQFRLIVSPDDGGLFDSLHNFTRELMARMEQDLGTVLDWIAVDHFDTGHPHTHVLMRGETEEGKVLQIAGNYISEGIRARASQVMTGWLGPQSEMEVQDQHVREIGAERLTKLDQDMLARAGDGLVDLRQSVTCDNGGYYQQMLISRARVLERMGLAEREGPLVWKLEPDLERTLRDVGQRGGIIRAMHDALTAAKLDRRPELFVIDRLDPGAGSVVGQVVHRGMRGEHHNRCFLVVDGIDGRVHYVEDQKGLEDVPVGSVIQINPKGSQRKIEKDQIARANCGFEDRDIHPASDRSAGEAGVKTHMQRLEPLRSRGIELEQEHSARASDVKIEILSRNGLRQESTLCAPTWLDRQLRHESVFEIAGHGFGNEVRHALNRRLQWLLEQGLAERRDDNVFYTADMDHRLRRAELGATVARLSKELGLDFAELRLGEPIVGALRRRIDLKSGQFALISNSQEFMLVPWRPVLQRYMNRELSGIMHGSGSISWRIGRARQAPEINM